MPAVPLATTLPYANAAKGPSITHPGEVTMVMVEVTEVLEALGTINLPGGSVTESSIPPGPQAGSHTTTALPLASPKVLPAVPPAVHLPISLTNFITDIPPSSTPRTV